MPGTRRARLVPERCRGAFGGSKATISKIERAEVNPTAAILVRLASALDLTLAGLMPRAEAPGERLAKAADQPVWRDPETGYVRRQVFSRPDHPVEMVTVELPPRRSVTLPAASYAHIRQLVWVQSARLTMTEGERVTCSMPAFVSALVRPSTRGSATAPMRPTPMSWLGPEVERKCPPSGARGSPG